METEARSALAKRVLVIRIGRLGDTILATTIIQALLQSCGQDVLIDFAVGPGAGAAVLNLDRRISRVFQVAHCRIPWPIHPAKQALRQYSGSMPYDLVFNLECGARCDDFIKFVHAREFYGRPLAEPRHMPGRHCVDTEKTIYADVLGFDVTAAAIPSLEILPGADLQPAGIDEDYIVLNPGFSGIHRKGYRGHRAWPLSHWSKLIDLITRSGRSVVVNGTIAESKYFASLLEKPGVHSRFGSSLAELVQVIAAARCMISVDTGSMHLAMALGTPTLALFGPTNPALTGPYPGKAQGIPISSGVDCRPCFQTPLQQRCKFNRCMHELEPEMAFSELDRLLSQGSSE